MEREAHVEFRGARSGDAPLTWGQRGMWTAVRRNAPGHFNIGRLLAVPRSNASVEDAAAAVGRLVARHESLRTRIRLTGGEPSQVVEGSGRLPLPVVDAGSSVHAAATALLARLVTARLEEPGAWPLRVGLVTAGGAVRSVVLVISHLAADWPATEIVLRDLRLLLRGDTPPAAPGLQPLDLARRQHEHDERLTRRAVDYWTAAYRRIPPTMFPLAGPAYQPPVQEVALISRAVYPAARLIAARHHVSTSTVLLAATAALAGVWAGQRTSAMSVVVSNRFRAGLGEMVGMLTQLGLFVLDADRHTTFDEVVGRARPAALRAHVHAHYDQAALDRATARVSEQRGTEINPYCCFNDLRETGDVPAAAAHADEHAVRAALADTAVTRNGHLGQVRCRFCLGVRDTADDMLDNGEMFAAGPNARVLKLSLRADTRSLPPDDLERFLRDMELLLVEGAFGTVRLARFGPRRDGPQRDVRRPVLGVAGDARA